jgi:polysaccharide export outer membrane protein
MFRSITGWLFFVLLALQISGCTANNPGFGSSTGFSSRQGFRSAQDRDLSPGDSVKLSVEVDGVMEVSEHPAEINRGGMVTLPLVGDVKVGGLTLAEARDSIAKTYGEYYVNPPVVMLTLAGDGSGGEWGYVTVLGRVNQPGRVPLQSPDGINLSAAVQLAEGFAPSARTSAIKVTRTDELGLQTRVTVDFEEIGEAGNVNADILLFEGDIVHVPERIF